jgi:outer membrane usher protein
VFLEARINGQDPEVAMFLRDAAGRLWVRGEDLKNWRLRLPASVPFMHGDEAFYALDGLRGVEYRVDTAAQSVAITLAAVAFNEQLLADNGREAPVPEHGAPGGFLNYDLLAAHSNIDTAAKSTLSGAFEAGVFNRFGSGTLTFLRLDPAPQRSLVRLDLTWTQDRPLARASLRIGDSISRAGSWGGAVRFGGVQWSTDFSTQPGFVTTPMAGLHGEAVLPSVVDVYVNDALRMRTTVPPGPFSIHDLPLVSGQGEARVIVRDVFGREQMVSVPYYSSPALLRPGLSSYSYEAGVARNNYGVTSNDYGRAIAVATHRQGFTDQLTGEVHAELLRDQQTVGFGGVFLHESIGALSAAVGTSRSTRGAGTLAQLGLEHQWSHFSLGGSARIATDHYAQLGMLPTDLAPVRIVQGFASFRLPHRGSAGVNYMQQDFRDKPQIHLLSLRASWSIGRSAFTTASAIRPLRGGGGTIVGVNMIYAFGSRSTASAGITREGQTTQGQLQLQQNLPVGRGVGYRVVAGMRSRDPIDGTVTYQNDVGTYALRSVKVGQQLSTSAEAQGGLALLGGRPYVSRRLDQSFAVVHVGDYPDVRVYADNQEVGRTDAHGDALVTRLRAYERNPLRIEQADLPLDAEIHTLQAEAVPYRRSGLRVDFDVHRSEGALLTLLLEDGTTVPVGAVAQIVGAETVFPVGMRGEAYVTGLSGPSRVRVSWSDQSCEVAVSFASTPDPLPRLGPFVCPGAHR